MKVFKKGFKPTVKFVIVFLAVALASYLLFKDVLKESFVDANYVIVGIKSKELFQLFIILLQILMLVKVEFFLRVEYPTIYL